MIRCIASGRSNRGSYSSIKLLPRAPSFSARIPTYHFLSSQAAQPPSTEHAKDESDNTKRNGLIRLLTEEERSLWSEQRSLSQRARDVASFVGNVKLDDLVSHDFLQQILAQQQETQNEGKKEHGEHSQSDDVGPTTFSIVIAGEFNSGKSTVINALLGSKLLEMGALPTTDEVTILANSAGAIASGNDGDHVHVVERARGGVLLHRVSGVPLLEDLTLIDTPGTNAVVDNHTQRTMKLLPTADLILFVTSADRPFPESERSLLRSIQDYRKNIVLIVNKMDVLEASGGSYGEGQKQQVVDFVTENASELLGARPIVIPISARDALSAKALSGDDASSEKLSSSRLWKRSNFANLESFLKDTLTTETKIKSKLANPVGVVQGIVSKSLDVLSKQRKELETDVATLNLLQGQLETWKKDMNHDMDTFRNDMKNMAQKEVDRIRILTQRMGFIDQYSWTIMDSTKFETEWANTRPGGVVSASSSSRINHHQQFQNEMLDMVQEAADGVATRARAQGQAVIEYLGKRPAIKSQSLVGSVTAASRFEDTKKNLSDKMSASVRSVLHDLDEERDQEMLLKSFRNTIIMSGSIHSCAIGTATATAMEVIDTIPGISGSTILAILGGYIVSHRNASVVKDYEKSWTDRSSKLDESLETVCTKELDKVQKKILDGVSPYTRYVQTEQDRVKKLTGQCEDIAAEAHTLKRRIEKLHHT